MHFWLCPAKIITQLAKNLDVVLVAADCIDKNTFSVQMTDFDCRINVTTLLYKIYRYITNLNLSLVYMQKIPMFLICESKLRYVFQTGHTYTSIHAGPHKYGFTTTPAHARLLTYACSRTPSHARLLTYAC